MSEDGVESELLALLSEAGVERVLGERLARYGALLLAANRHVNLTGAKNAAALAAHLLDSLTLAPMIEPESTLVDVGSGGGLPGIPIALATGAHVTLIEPIAKKAAFLQDALAACGVPGEALAQRAEAAARDPRLRERFDYATARAVSSAPTVAELTVPFLRIGGRALLQRGALDEREHQALADAAPVLGAELVEERPVGGDLRILVLLKRRAVSERFPRRNGVPGKRPLCL